MISAREKQKSNFLLTENIYIIYLLITFLSTVHIEIFNVFKTYTDYICLFFVALMILSKNRIYENDVRLFLPALIVFPVVVLFNKGGIGSIVTIFSGYLMFFAFPNSGITKNGKKKMLCLAILFLLFSFFKSFLYRSDWQYHRFNDINPNTMGMYVMFSIAIVIAFLDFKIQKNRIILFVIFLLSLVSLINYESRGCLFSTILLVCLLISYKKVNRRLLFGIIIMILIIGTIFPIIYVNLYRSGKTLTFLNKSLYTGREIIWDGMFFDFEKNANSWIIGLGSHIGGGDLNIHNNYFAVIVNFGLIGYVLYYGFILSRLKLAIFNSNDDENVKYALIFVVTILVLGFTEVTSLWSLMYPFSYLFLSLSSNSCKKKNCEESYRRWNVQNVV